MICSKVLAPVLTAAALQLALPSIATAQAASTSSDQTTRARDLFRQGAAAMKDGKYADARKALQQAWDIRRSYDVAATLGQVELELKAFRDAAEHLDFALKNLAPRESVETMDNIKSGLHTAKQHVAEVRLSVNEPYSQISLDGKDAGVSPLPSSLFVDIGPHTVEARLGADRVAKQSLQTFAGNAYTVELTVPPPRASGQSLPSSGLGAAPAPPHGDRSDGERSLVPVFVGGGVAVVGLALGIGYRASAASRQDDVTALQQKNGRDGCATGTAAPADCAAVKSAAESVDSRRNLSTASFVVGGAALLGTAVYWFWPRSSNAADARRSNFLVSGAPAANGGSIVVSGSF